MAAQVPIDLLVIIFSTDISPRRLGCFSQVSKLFHSASQHHMLWGKIFEGTWRASLSASCTTPSEYREAYSALELTSSSSVSCWNQLFAAHSAEPLCWQCPISDFLVTLIPETEHHSVRAATSRQSAAAQLCGEALAETLASAVAVAPAAQFLMQAKMGRAMRGEFMGCCEGIGLPLAMVQMLPLEGVDVVTSLRLVLDKICTQTSYSLNRVMRALGFALHQNNPELDSAEAAHSLIYAGLMLNTDMYSTNVKHEHRMTKPIFVEKVGEMLRGHSVEPAVIEDIFESIATGGPLRVGAEELQVVHAEDPPVGTQFMGFAEGCVIC